MKRESKCTKLLCLSMYFLILSLQFYTDSQFAAPHFRQLSLLSRSPDPLFVYKFEQTGGPDLYGNTLNISGILTSTLFTAKFIYLLTFPMLRTRYLVYKQRPSLFKTFLTFDSVGASKPLMIFLLFNLCVTGCYKTHSKTIQVSGVQWKDLKLHREVLH
jgi:hypothetical protein